MTTIPHSKRPLIGCTTYHVELKDPTMPAVNGLMPSYLNAVIMGGGTPLLIPHGLAEEQLADVLSRVDGIMLPGGGDIHPAAYNGHYHKSIWGIDQERDRIEIFAARYAVERQKPLLAICRGHQVLNVALGGTLWEDIESQNLNAQRHNYFKAFPRNYLAHPVEITPNSLLAKALDSTETAVNSLHHQGVRDLAPELTATAVSQDGLVEAVEVTGHPFALGVQWHPENLVTDLPSMLRIFQTFVAKAATP